MYADLSSGLLTIRKRLKSYSFMGATLCLTMANKNSPIFKGIPRAFLSMSERDISGPQDDHPDVNLNYITLSVSLRHTHPYIQGAAVVPKLFLGPHFD